MFFSEDEQFFINALLPDIHQVDLPDVWIGVSGIRTFSLCMFLLHLSLLYFPLHRRISVLRHSCVHLFVRLLLYRGAYTALDTPNLFLVRYFYT